MKNVDAGGGFPQGNPTFGGVLGFAEPQPNLQFLHHFSRVSPLQNWL
ncbi:MAG: hypothetical protein RMY28_013325 [Nostoc sp. ChiSLP01]|nr:hypothetical protein [Nostoc sp. CmiSLP01]MDZ8285610.1 hypothetical protein [Nostoc sp. ChiSLP01]